MGIFSLLPIMGMAVLFLFGGSPHAAGPDLTVSPDTGFDMMVTGQSLVAAIMLFAGIRLARGRRRGG